MDIYSIYMNILNLTQVYTLTCSSHLMWPMTNNMLNVIKNRRSRCCMHVHDTRLYVNDANIFRAYLNTIKHYLGFIGLYNSRFKT